MSKTKPINKDKNNLNWTKTKKSPKYRNKQMALNMKVFNPRTRQTNNSPNKINRINHMLGKLATCAIKVIFVHGILLRPQRKYLDRMR